MQFKWMRFDRIKQFNTIWCNQLDTIHFALMELNPIQSHSLLLAIFCLSPGTLGILKIIGYAYGPFITFRKIILIWFVEEYILTLKVQMSKVLKPKFYVFQIIKHFELVIKFACLKYLTFVFLSAFYGNGTQDC